jgi:hypothetical protein
VTPTLTQLAWPPDGRIPLAWAVRSPRCRTDLVARAWKHTRDVSAMVYLLALTGRNAEAARVTRVLRAYLDADLPTRQVAEHVRCMGIAPPTLAEVLAARSREPRGDG